MLKKCPSKIDEMAEKLDRQEQYSRRNCILIHGLAEQWNENTDQLVLKNHK